MPKLPKPAICLDMWFICPCPKDNVTYFQRQSRHIQAYDSYPCLYFPALGHSGIIKKLGFFPALGHSCIILALGRGGPWYQESADKTKLFNVTLAIKYTQVELN